MIYNIKSQFNKAAFLIVPTTDIDVNYVMVDILPDSDWQMEIYGIFWGVMFLAQADKTAFISNYLAIHLDYPLDDNGANNLFSVSNPAITGAGELMICKGNNVLGMQNENFDVPMQIQPGRRMTVYTVKPFMAGALTAPYVLSLTVRGKITQADRTFRLGNLTGR